MIYISLSFLLLETISHPNSSFEPKYNSSFVHPFSSHPLPLPPLSSPLTPRYSHISHLLLNINLNPFSYIFSPPLEPLCFSSCFHQLSHKPSSPCFFFLSLPFSYFTVPIPPSLLLLYSSYPSFPSPTLQFLSLLPFSYFTVPIPPSLLFYPTFLLFYLLPSILPSTFYPSFFLLTLPCPLHHLPPSYSSTPRLVT